MIFTISGINPEPWTAPEVSIGRKGGKVFPMVYKTQTLRSYQEAVKDHLEGHTQLIDDKTPFSLRFWFWRQLPSYDIADGRKSRRHVADATNLQKALEDALQGILYKNDRYALVVESQIVEQDADTVPGVVIEIKPLVGHPVPSGEVTLMRDLILKEASIPPEADPRAGIDVEDVF